MAKKRKKPVNEELRVKLFLWCARHCCFCGKPCTTNIEIHHIDGDKGNNDEDNLVPLCFNCHGELNRYNPEHPKGSKYRSLEIKRRRKQLYELHTRQYVRPVDIKISKYSHQLRGKSGEPIPRAWGDYSCTVRTLSQDIPVRLRLRMSAYRMNRRMNVRFGDLYSGTALWNLNPAQAVFGHFRLPISPRTKTFHFRIEAFWSIVDVLNREHLMLPFSYVWEDPEKDWYYDPRILSETQDGRTRS